MDEMLDLIKVSLWENGKAVANNQIFEEMKKHAIASLPASCLHILGLSHDLETTWKRFIIQQIAFYKQSAYEQSNLPISVPYVILKGTSAAKYYPHPEYRAIGDIDIMTRREDFDLAYHQLLDGGYQVIQELNREISLTKKGFIVELHRRFATLNDPEKAKYLDDLIIDNISSLHMLPDLINGLVLLEHIDQHLEGGLGLRQIIDWMMFVDKCLPDDKWKEFLPIAEKTGLVKLAIACTRMCEMHLGLSHREWCTEADESLCNQLMEYVLSCGNFGNKKKKDEDISQNVFAFSSTPKMAYRLLQRRGMKNWKAAKKHKILKPFAWIYQAFRYAVRGLKRDQATIKIKDEYKAARKRNAMFEALGVKTMAKGVVIYKDGEYVNE